MTKKTWITLLVVVLVVAAIVAIYFLTRPAAELPEPTAAPAAVVTEAPMAVTEAPMAVATDAPAAATAAP